MKKTSLHNAFTAVAPEQKNDGLGQNLVPPFVIAGDEKAKQRITRLINQIVISETGRKTLEIASKAGYAIGLEFVLGSNGGCSKEKKAILLSPLSDDALLTGVLVHEARHAGQFERGEYDASDDRRPRKETLKTAIMRTRAVEADAQATAAQALGEMMEAGNIDPLRAFSKANPEIGKAFGWALYEDDALKNGKARTAAFLAWYENDDIKKAYDIAYQVEMMTRRAANGTNAEDTYNEIQSTTKIVKDLCLNENGSNYFTENPDIIAGSKFLTVDPTVSRQLNNLMSKVPSKPGKEGNFLPFKAHDSDSYETVFGDKKAEASIVKEKMQNVILRHYKKDR